MRLVGVNIKSRVLAEKALESGHRLSVVRSVERRFTGGPEFRRPLRMGNFTPPSTQGRVCPLLRGLLGKLLTSFGPIGEERPDSHGLSFPVGVVGPVSALGVV